MDLNGSLLLMDWILFFYHPLAISLTLLIFFATVDNFPQASGKYR